MLDIRISDHVAPLVGVLADLLGDSPADPFTPEWVAVPSIGMRRWLAQQLSTRLGATPGRRDGISSNVHMPFPSELRRAVLAADSAARGLEVDPWSTGRLLWAVLAVLDAPETASDRLLAPLTHRVDGSTRAGRAASLADLVDRYLLHRPEMIRRWVATDDVDGLGNPLPDHHRWQPALVRALRARLGVPSPAERFDGVLDGLRCGELEVDLPERLFLFGMSTLPPDTGAMLRALSERRSVHGLLLTPSTVVARSVISHARGSFGHRRPGPSSSVLSRRQVELDDRVAHPLLRSWGAPSRETAALLGAFDLQVEEVVGVADVGASTVLGHLQAGLRRDAVTLPSGSAPVIEEGDRSLQVHSCTGVTRQVEVLRDVLLHLLAEDDTLTEGDIAVLCPRVEELAPVIQGVLGPSVDRAAAEDPLRPPALRYRITDRSMRAEVPLLGALAALVDLLSGRFAASEVADVLGLEPVRDRFGFGAEDLAAVEEWIESAEIRWGMDGPHRSRWGLPPDLDANSWATGLDRLLVGTAVHPDGVTLAVGGVAPVQIGDGAAVGVARVADAVRTLDVLRSRVQESRPIAEWCRLLAEAVEQTCSLPHSESWQRRRLDGVLADLLDTSMATTADGTREPSTVPLTLADLRRLLTDRLGGDPARAAFGTGAVTVCSLSPLRSVPHRVVCILGLDQDALPRGVVGGDDLIAAAPALGDRDPRTESRHLLLEAVLSAGETLVITCNGADVRTNAPVPPAVVLDELWDCLGPMLDLAPSAVRDRLQITHPRHAFDERNFEPGEIDESAAVPWSFDPAALDAAIAVRRRDREPDAASAVLVTEALPDGERPTVRALDELLQFLRSPVTWFMRRTLQVRFPETDEALPDDLPVSLSGLERSRIGTVLLEARQVGRSVDAVAGVLRAAGSIPPGSLGDVEIDEVAGEIEAFADLAADLGVPLSTAALEPVDAVLADGTVLRGVIPLHRGGPSGPGPLAVRYSRPKPHHVLILGAQLLVLTVAQPDQPWRAVSIHRSTGKGGSPVLHDLTVRGETAEERSATALGALGALVELWGLGSRLPLPLFDATSQKLAAGEAARAASAWEDSWGSGESDDAAVRLAFGSLSFDELRSLEIAGHDPLVWARRLWEPLRAALDEQGEPW